MASGMMTDRLVLSMWDGRPTLNIIVVDGMPYLEWLLIGYVEPFDLWLGTKLDWEEADAIIEQVPQLMDDYLSQRPGHRIRLKLSLPTRGWEIIGDWEIQPNGFDVREAMTWMAGHAQRELRRLRPRTPANDLREMENVQRELAAAAA